MKYLHTFILVILIFAGCQKDALFSSYSGDTAQATESDILVAKKKLAHLIQTKKLVSKIDLITASNNNRAPQMQTRGSISDKVRKLAENADFMYYKNLVKRVINPKDYQCDTTFLDTYIISSVKNWTRLDFTLYQSFGDIAIWEAFLVDNTDGKDYFGAKGEFTHRIYTHMEYLKHFWDIPTDIHITDAHASVYENVQLVAKLIQVAYAGVDEKDNLIPVPDDEALQVAQTLKLVFGSKPFARYTHPLLTFNAFADTGDPEAGLPKKIVMGDGIMQAYNELGYGDVAPEFILAHEYGHQVDFANDNIDFKINTPEYTRKAELRADAYSGYYIGHGQGFGLPQNKLENFLKVPYSVGDCAFTDPGHHGTPNQRKKATRFGYQTATEADKRDYRLKGQEFFRLYDAAYPNIILPDAKGKLMGELIF